MIYGNVVENHSAGFENKIDFFYHFLFLFHIFPFNEKPKRMVDVYVSSVKEIWAEIEIIVTHKISRILEGFRIFIWHVNLID